MIVYRDRIVSAMQANCITGIYNNCRPDDSGMRKLCWLNRMPTQFSTNGI